MHQVFWGKTAKLPSERLAISAMSITSSSTKYANQIYEVSDCLPVQQQDASVHRLRLLIIFKAMLPEKKKVYQSVQQKQ